MAVAVQVAGLTTVKVGTGTAGALETLGYTQDGADIKSQPFFLNVPGDEKGGTDGPPIDVQMLGEIHTIHLELTKWDTEIEDKITCYALAGTAGTPPSPGTLMFGDAVSVRLLLSCSSGPRNYPRAILRGGYAINKGTKFSTLILDFEAHEDASGVLWNTTTTG